MYNTFNFGGKILNFVIRMKLIFVEKLKEYIQKFLFEIMQSRSLNSNEISQNYSKSTQNLKILKLTI